MISIMYVKSSFAQEINIQQVLWTGIGGQQNWLDTNYLMYNCYGNDASDLLKNNTERSLLWDKKNGNCRFEGIAKNGEEIIYLFNLITEKSIKLGINNVEEQNLDPNLTKAIMLQIKKDLQLMLLPTIIDIKGTNFNHIEDKLSNGEKLIYVNVLSKLPFYGSSINGILSISEKSGEIKGFDNTNTDLHYQIENYKDTGSGLILPSSFLVADNKQKSCTFTIISSFLQVEVTKFTDL